MNWREIQDTHKLPDYVGVQVIQDNHKFTVLNGLQEFMGVLN